MKCPKCGYLGFESIDRCRNCGYDFSLAAPSEPLDLPLRQSPVESMPGPADELPLFSRLSKSTAADADDAPLIAQASPPRPPLAVRRATPDPPRVRHPAARPTPLHLALEAPVADRPGRDRTPASTVPAAAREPAGVPGADGANENASLGTRLLAAALDAVILGAVDVAVVYLTLQICGVGLDEIRLLPWVPLGAFLVLQNGGYLVVFTAGGQTLGKMAAGIRVVAADTSMSLDMGRAFIRELAWLVLALPAGAGLLSAAFSRDRRGLHDRFAGTRVVRASW